MKIYKFIMTGLAFCLLGMLAVSNVQADEVLDSPYCSGLKCELSNGCLKDETPADGFTLTAPAGSIFSQVWVKASNVCTSYTQDTNDGCYEVLGIGTATVTVTKVGVGPACSDISHIEAIIKPTVVDLVSFTAKCRQDLALILVRWSTASELYTVGFNIWRTTKPEEPSDNLYNTAVKVNDSLIPPMGGQLLGADYRLKDRNFVIGTRYFYYLEEIDSYHNNWYDIVPTARCTL